MFAQPPIVAVGVHDSIDMRTPARQTSQAPRQARFPASQGTDPRSRFSELNILGAGWGIGPSTRWSSRYTPPFSGK